MSTLLLLLPNSYHFYFTDRTAAQYLSSLNPHRDPSSHNTHYGGFTALVQSMLFAFFASHLQPPTRHRLTLRPPEHPAHRVQFEKINAFLEKAFFFGPDSPLPSAQRGTRHPPRHAQVPVQRKEIVCPGRKHDRSVKEPVNDQRAEKKADFPRAARCRVPLGAES